MKDYLFLVGCCLTLLNGCTHIDPGLTKDLDDAITDQVIRVEVDKEAMQKDTDIEISVRIINKDPPVKNGP